MAISMIGGHETPGRPTRVLVVEDDANIRALLVSYLEATGFEVEGVADGRSAIARIERGQLDFLIIDLMIPEPSGFDIVKLVRGQGPLPIIILSAREAEEDRIRGLSLGADDYVVKPFSPRELVERVRAVLRRAATSLPQRRTGTFSYGPLTFDTAAAEVRADDEPLNLTPSEYRILACLAKTPGRVFTRTQLLDAALPKRDADAATDRTVDVHVANLRRKLHQWPELTRALRTVRGFGYRLDQNPSDEK